MTEPQGPAADSQQAAPEQDQAQADTGATRGIPYSDAISSGRLDMKKVIQPTYDEINKQYGLHETQK